VADKTKKAAHKKDSPYPECDGCRFLVFKDSDTGVVCSSPEGCARTTRKSGSTTGVPDAADKPGAKLE